MPGLTKKQEIFCQEYMVDFNATQAAIRAGYSKNTAKAIGCENLTKPDIQLRLEHLGKELSKKIGISQQDVIEGLIEAKDLARKLGRPGDMISAWSWIGRYHAMFTDKVKGDYTDMTAEERAEYEELQRYKNMSAEERKLYLEENGG